MKVFIVILNWNRANDTIECLKSVSELRIKNYKLSVVVVDNASSDGSSDKINTFLHATDYKLLVNNVNLGYVGGNNVGIKYALKNGANFILVLNNDTLLDKNLIAEFLEASKKYPDAGILSPKIYFAKGYEFHKDKYRKTELGKVIWYAGGKIDWDNVYGINEGVDEVDRGQFEKEREIDFATGTCMFIRVNALKKTGAFNEKYFMYLEDVELSMRMMKKGWKIVYVPKAKIWHKVAQSSRIGSNLNDYFITRNRLLFGMKYARLRTRFALYRESLRLLINGRKWQKKGIVDFYFGRFGKGSWE